MAVTISPRITGTLIIRFEDGSEAELGKVTYRPDINFTIEADDVKWEGR